MNKLILIGRVVRDFNCEYTTNGDAVCAFSLAVNRTKDKADFLKVKVYGKQAENAAKYLSKGSQVCVEGSMQSDSYKNKNDETRYDTYCFASRIEFLGKKTEADKPQLNEADFEVGDHFSAVEDDIPF